MSNGSSRTRLDPTPHIQQRKISSTVAVNSGDTIILGGLIQENRDLSESGIPFFHKIPGLGALFGTKADNQERNELIVLITPRAIADSTAALQVTEDYRRRLKKLIPNRQQETTDTQAAPASTDSKPVTPVVTASAAPVPEPAVVTQPVQGPPPKQPAQTVSTAGPAPQATAGSADSWVVQVASFKNRNGAEELAGRLREAGIVTHAPKPVQVKGNTWYRVQASGGDSREQAKRLIAKIKDIAGLQGIIVRNP